MNNAVTDVYDEQMFDSMREEIDSLKALAYIYPPIPRFNKKGQTWRDLCDSHWNQIMILRAMLWQAHKKCGSQLSGDLFTAGDFERAALVHECEVASKSLDALTARQEFMKNLKPSTLQKIMGIRENQDNNLFKN